MRRNEDKTCTHFNKNLVTYSYCIKYNVDLCIFPLNSKVCYLDFQVLTILFSFPLVCCWWCFVFFFSNLCRKIALFYPVKSVKGIDDLKSKVTLISPNSMNIIDIEKD